MNEGAPTPKKVFVGQNNIATFQCPKCNKSKTADVSRYMNIDVAVRFKPKCPCGYSYTVLLERRKHVRNNLNLPGRYSFSKGNERGSALIVDLSQSGLRIKLNFKIDIQVGDKLTVEFNLDDAEESNIRKEMVVRSINDLHLGTEFVSKDHYDKLGSYLLYHFR